MQALRVGGDRAAEPRVEVGGEGELARLGDVAEVPLERLAQAGERHLLALDGDRARLDLREVEDVADQVQEVGAGAVDRLRELDLLRRQVAVGVVAELLAEDQDAVERRAQLVRHVREELGLVARGERELGGLLLDRPARLVDLLVLALDLGVLRGELLRLLAELLVGLLQLLLLRLQLGGELLRLLEQPLGAHRRLDRVQHDADRAGELLEEREVRRGEPGERRELDDRPHLVLEQHRQHDDVLRLGGDQPGADPDRRLGISVSRIRCRSTAHCPTRPSPMRNRRGSPGSGRSA